MRPVELLKKRLGSLIRVAARMPGVNTLLDQPSLRATLKGLPVFNQIYAGGWGFKHPFDRLHNTDTSGFVSTEELPTSPFDRGGKGVYAGSQPSIIRAALRALPALESFTFVDLGCGKGRAMIVASEFAFREIVGVELSESLVRDGLKNAAVLRRRFPTRVPLRVELHDATTFPLPAGNLVIFLYNPFGEQAIAKVIAMLETLPADRQVFIVYYNPVHGHCFDASRKFSRYFAATLPYSPEEIGYGPDETDTVIIWQTGNLPALRKADAEIRVMKPDVRAELVDN